MSAAATNRHHQHASSSAIPPLTPPTLLRMQQQHYHNSSVGGGNGNASSSNGSGVVVIGTAPTSATPVVAPAMHSTHTSSITVPSVNMVRGGEETNVTTTVPPMPTIVTPPSSTYGIPSHLMIPPQLSTVQGMMMMPDPLLSYMHSRFIGRLYTGDTSIVRQTSSTTNRTSITQ